MNSPDDEPNSGAIPEQTDLVEDLAAHAREDDELDEQTVSEAARRVRLLGKLIIPRALY